MILPKCKTFAKSSPSACIFVSAFAQGYPLEQLISQLNIVSVTGITGTRDDLPSGLDKFVAKVLKVATQPLCIGFGISTPGQASQLAKIADGVIVGSQVVQLMEIGDDFTSAVNFIKELRHALDKSH